MTMRSYCAPDQAAVGTSSPLACGQGSLSYEAEVEREAKCTKPNWKFSFACYVENAFEFQAASPSSHTCVTLSPSRVVRTRMAGGLRMCGRIRGPPHRGCLVAYFCNSADSWASVQIPPRTDISVFLACCRLHNPFVFFSVATATSSLLSSSNSCVSAKVERIPQYEYTHFRSLTRTHRWLDSCARSRSSSTRHILRGVQSRRILATPKSECAEQDRNVGINTTNLNSSTYFLLYTVSKSTAE
jgi:hypothetical protein